MADPRPGASYDYKPAPQSILDRALQLQAICAEHGVPLRAAALQFPLRQPAVSTALVGVHNAAEWRQNVELMRLPIPDELWQALA